MWSNRTAGSVGLAVSLVLWAISLWRVLFHLLCARRYREHERIAESMSTHGWLTRRRAFHSLLWLAMTVECVAYADVSRLVPLSQNRNYAVKLGYVLLEVVGRAIFEFSAFAVVTLMWFRTATTTPTEGTRLERTAPSILVGTGVNLIVVSVWQAIDILSRVDGSTVVFRVHLLVEGFSWGVQAGITATCSHLTARRILRLSALPPRGSLDRNLILAKPLIPMLLSGMCYASRSVWLMALFLRQPTTASIPDRFSTVWWIGFVWIPTLIPAIMLLYSARKRDPQFSLERMDRAHSPLLLPTPVPPAEAFISFRRFQQGDIMSPLSPIPRSAINEESDDSANDKNMDDNPKEGDPKN